MDRLPLPGCAQVEEAISAGLDAEPPGLDDVEVQRHLDVCVSCADFARRAPQLSRRLRVSPAPQVPDLSGAIVAAVRAVGPRRTVRPQRTGRPHRGVRAMHAARAGLVAVGLAQLALAVPLLLGVHGSDHLLRHLAVLELALGVGLIVAGVQPRLASGLLPVVGVAAGASLALAGVDVLRGHTTVLAEAVHLTELLGLLGLVILVRSGRLRVRPGTWVGTPATPRHGSRP